MDDDVLAGRYRRVRLLGRGAMGEVWLAEDELLHRRVAVKSILSSATQPSAPDLDRIVREARTAAGLNHPNAVSVYDLVLVGDRPHLVMEYVDGQTLAEETGRPGGMDAERVGALGALIADAIAEAHHLGIVHRDLKPANIMLTTRGSPKVADFGIARMTGDAHTTATGMVVGTPAFVAPEVARGAPADSRSDIWSLGVTLYTALEGHTPFHRAGDEGSLVVLSRVLEADVAPPRRTGPVADAIMTLLAPDPWRRPGAAEAAAALRRAAAEERAGAAPPTVVARQYAPTEHGFASPGYGTPGYASTGYPATNYPATNYPSTNYGARPYAPSSYLTPPTAFATPPPPRAPQHSGRKVALLAAGCVVLVAAAAGAVVLLADRGHGSPSAAASQSPAAHHRSSAVPTSSSAPPAFGTSGETTPAAASSGPSAPSVYDGPGGVAVQGPQGWRDDDSAHVASITDYVQPGRTLDSGAFFRIGIGNENPAPTIRQEAHQSVKFLKHSSGYTDISILREQFLTYLGSPAVDIDSLGTNPDGFPRHNEQRLWISNGVTYEIELNTPSAAWSGDQHVYDQLVSSCSVD